MKRNKPNPNRLESDIRQLFATKAQTAFTPKEVLDALCISHKYYADVKNLILGLLTAGYLKKDKNKYVYHGRTDLSKPEEGQSQPAVSPNLIQGTFDATPLARNHSFAFVKTDKGDFFVSSEDILNAFHGDTILMEPHYKNGKPDYCYIRKIIKRANDKLTGDIQISAGRAYFVCSNPKIHQWFEVTETNAAQTGQKVVLEVQNWGNRLLSKAPYGKVIEILGQSGNPETELLAVIRQYNLPLDFSETVVHELSSLPTETNEAELKSRTDLRDLVTFTIDPSSAKDYDDAISLIDTTSGWTLYVHIADVAHYVQPQSALFAEAVNRGNSYYFPRKVIPMLPEIISNKLCSLRQDEDKLTLSVKTDFNRQGKILHQSLCESIIRSSARLSYEQVDELFEGKSAEIIEPVALALNSARELSQLLSQQRDKDGYLFFDLPETGYLYDEEGFVHQMVQNIETESHKLIENFMLVANEYVATILTDKAPAVMYRIHEYPDMEKLERLEQLISAYGLTLRLNINFNFSLQELLHSFPDEIYHRVFDRLVLRSLKKAKYTVEHLPHFGLAIDTYTHFTSPIRRLCDLVIHHLCKTYVIKSSHAEFTRTQIIQYATISSEKEILADEAERDIDRVMNIIFMKEKIGEVFQGIIISISNSAIIVQLDTIPITGVVKVASLTQGRWFFQEAAMRLINERSGTFFQLMDAVTVKVVQASDDVYFELMLIPGSPTHHVSCLTPQPTQKKGKYAARHTAGNSKQNKRNRHEKTHRHF